MPHSVEPLSALEHLVRATPCRHAHLVHVHAPGPLTALPQLARESDGSGGLIRRYLSDIEGASTMQTSSGSFYYLRDQQGSAAQLTDGSANTEWSYVYEPFGREKTATKVDPSAPDNPLQFNAQYLDTGSGLYDLRARQYDSSDGRFPLNRPALVAAN
jgi:RHS repeat-associated protein